MQKYFKSILRSVVHCSAINTEQCVVHWSTMRWSKQCIVHLSALGSTMQWQLYSNCAKVLRCWVQCTESLMQCSIVASMKVALHCNLYTTSWVGWPILVHWIAFKAIPPNLCVIVFVVICNTVYCGVQFSGCTVYSGTHEHCASSLYCNLNIVPPAGYNLV